jgi:ABC-2 type transport system ATP-binding protein
VRAIECRGIAKSYRGRQALLSLDLDVPRGAVVGFLGPNGAGKTTAIRILSTVLTPDAGSFSVAGCPGNEPVQVRRRIGVLHESSGFSSAQTGTDVVRFHARLHGLSRSDASTRAQELLHSVGLADRAGSQVAYYSRGMRQRLGIARALVHRPAVVFLDEPTLGLDPSGQRDILQLIASIARDDGTTVVLTTHLLGEVEEICDSVIILNRGRVAASGTVAEVTRQVAAPGRGRLRVPPTSVNDAHNAMASVTEVASVVAASMQGEFTFEVTPGVAVETASVAIGRALAGCAVPVLELTFEGARLSDAFLALTDTR